MKMSLAVLITSILTSTIKVVSVPIALIILGEYPVWEIIFSAFIGGALGSVLFYFIGQKLFGYLSDWMPSKPKKHNSSKKRRIIKMKNKIGVWGLSASIGILSVPVGAILVAKYFPNHRWAIPSLVFWSFIWTLLATFIPLAIITLF